MFIINSIVITISGIVMRTLSVAFGVYVSNKIGSEALGIFQIVTSIYMFFITLATSGISLASTRVVSEELVSNNISGSKKAMKQCIIYSFCIGIISGIMLFLSSPFISINWLHEKTSYIPFYILSISLPFISVSSAITGYFYALRKVYKNSSSQIINQFIRIFATTYLLNLFLPRGLEWACISLVLGSTISEILSCTYLFGLYKFNNKKNTNSNCILDYKKRIFKITIPVSITSYIRSGLSTLKQILIPMRLEHSGLSREQALSKYGIITGMTMPILMFPGSFLTAFSELLIPEFSDYNYTGSHKQINYIMSRILKITFIFSILIAGIFWTFSNELSILLYKNIEVSFFLKSMCLLAPLIYVDNIIDGILKGLNKQVGVMLTNILDLFITITFIYFLLPIQGVYGYIIILFISEILNLIISLIILIRTTNLKINFHNWIIKPCIGLIFAYSTTIIIKLDNPNILIKFILGLILFIISYLGFLIFSSCINMDDLQL